MSKFSAGLTKDQVDADLLLTKELFELKTPAVISDTIEDRQWFSPPSSTIWPNDLPNILARKNGDNYECNLTPQDFVDITTYTTKLYVDGINGDNANDGSTWALAIKSIGVAVDAAIASATATQIIVKSGIYTRHNSISQTTPAKVLTAPLSIKAVYGRVETGPFETLTWSVNGTYSTVYEVARSVAQRVFNPQLADQYGEHLEYTYAASLADCSTTPGSWFTDNVTVYVHTHSSGPANDGNARVYLESKSCTFSGNYDFYMSHIDCMGGDAASANFSGGSTNIVILENCTFKHAVKGKRSTGLSGANGVTVLGCKLFAAFNCEATENGKDGFNLHKEGAVIPTGLLVNCKGFRNGVKLLNEQSCNGLTTHDGIKSIDIGGQWLGSVGTNSGHIDAGTECWSFGTIAGDSDGDIIAGGTINFGAFGMWLGDSDSVLWLEYCKDVGSEIGLYGAGGGAGLIYYRNHEGSGTKTNATAFTR